MRSLVAIVFLLAGVGLILTPLIYDHLRAERTADVLRARTDLKEVDLGPGMDDQYRWACWITGGLTILLGVWLAREGFRRSGHGLNESNRIQYK